MKLDTNTHHYTELARWYRKTKTLPIRKAVTLKVSELRHNLDGNNALYLGLPEFRKKFESTKYLSFFSVDGKDIIKYQSIEKKLPFEDKSHDIIILMHALDLLDKPYNFIREIDRIASDDAKIFIVGFNKLSLWGLTRQLRNKHHSPWSANFHPISNIKEWFKILSYDVKINTTSCLLPFLSKSLCKYMDKFSFLQKLLFPSYGGIYFCLLTKKIVPLTPQKLKFKDKYVVHTFPKSSMNRFK